MNEIDENIDNSNEEIQLDKSTNELNQSSEEDQGYTVADITNAIRELEFGMQINLMIADVEGEKVRQYKQTYAKDIVNNLEILKSVPSEQIPEPNRNQYGTTCSRLRDQDSYVHQEVLNRVLASYEEDTEGMDEEKLDISHLKRTAFYLELFDEITGRDIEIQVINRHPQHEKLREIRTKVAKVEYDNWSYTGSEMTETVMDDNTSQRTSTVKKEQKFQKVDWSGYLDDVFDVYDRLDSTISEFENRLYKHDSPEFTNLMKTAAQLSELRDQASRYKPGKALDQALEKELNMLMPTLYEQTKQYIQHCADVPKSGSRRKTRYKNAQRLLHVCEAFRKRITVRDHLQNEIAETILMGLTEREKQIQKENFHPEEAIKLERCYEKASWRKKEVEESIKPHEAFKTMIRGAHDTFDLYHMIENPVQTHTNFTKIFRQYKKNLEDDQKKAAASQQKDVSRTSSRESSFIK